MDEIKKWSMFWPLKNYFQCKFVWKKIMWNFRRRLEKVQNMNGTRPQHVLSTPKISGTHRERTSNTNANRYRTRPEDIVKAIG